MNIRRIANVLADDKDNVIHERRHGFLRGLDSRPADIATVIPVGDLNEHEGYRLVLKIGASTVDKVYDHTRVNFRFQLGSIAFALIPKDVGETEGKYFFKHIMV